MANPNAGDVLTYYQNQWINQPWVQGNFGVGGSPTYQLHAFQGTSGFFYSDQSGTPLAGIYNNKPQQWTFRCDPTTGRFDIRDDETGRGERLSIDTSGHVGIGTTSPNSTLHVNGGIAINLVSKTANYTLTASDGVATGNATGGAFTLTLPTAVGIPGRAYTVKKTDSSANAVTVGTTSSQTIDGAATYSLSAQNQFVTVVSDGANWIIVAK